MTLTMNSVQEMAKTHRGNFRGQEKQRFPPILGMTHNKNSVQLSRSYPRPWQGLSCTLTARRRTWTKTRHRCRIVAVLAPARRILYVRKSAPAWGTKSTCLLYNRRVEREWDLFGAWDHTARVETIAEFAATVDCGLCTCDRNIPRKSREATDVGVGHTLRARLAVTSQCFQLKGEKRTHFADQPLIVNTAYETEKSKPKSPASSGLQDFKSA